MKCFSLFCCFYLLISFLCALCCNAADSTITQNQPLRDGQTIVSLSESFEFGFFTPEGSKNRYVGIWYHKRKPQTIVWVANREHPLTEYSKGGVVTIGQDGNMLVLDGNGTSIWSTNASLLATDSIAMLQDSGNLILKEPNSNIFIWQSFDHPTDTFLPGMKLMISSKQNRFLSSWRSPINPEVGIFKFGYESNKLSLWHGLITYWTSGAWNGSMFEMVPPENAQSSLFKLTKVIEGNEVYFTYSSPLNKTRLVMNVNGVLEFYILDLDSWLIDWWLPKAPCDYVSCGSFGRCYYTDINLFNGFGYQRDYALCECLPGFEPTSQKNWEAGDWSGGCKRRTPLGCDNNEEDGFISYNLVRIENTTISSYQVETAENCRSDCLHNCNCSAYAYTIGKYVGATTCKIWDGDLRHVQLVNYYYVQEVEELFIRMAALEIEHTQRCENCGNHTIPYPLSTGTNCGDPAYRSYYCCNATGGLFFNTFDGHSYRVNKISPETQTMVIQTVKIISDDKPCWGLNAYDIGLSPSLPFYLTTNNIIVMFDCPTPLNSSLLSNSICNSSLCQKLQKNGCISSSTNCCSYIAGNSSSTSHSIGVLTTGCKTYTSTLKDNLMLLIANRSLGVEIGWKIPSEPQCDFSKDCQSWPHSTCRADKTEAKMRCICNENFLWNPSVGYCVEDMTHYLRSSSSRRPSRRSLFGIVFPLTSITVILFLGTIGYWWRKKSLKRKDAQRAKVILGADKFRKNGRKDLDIPFFDFQSIAVATNNFSNSNKLGQGGFGPVYKGSLPGGQKIAVKRLSRCSGQGLEEFKTEVILIAKLQHRNLVRLLGFCVQGDEQMLLYEYMPNKSLDYYLFDQNRPTLDWEKRLGIISGIARGLLYLHQDSRLRIIHRDLKPSNILLDELWNPKISDFGMARIVGENQTQANTSRVVGTYGYMPPEYALEGTYSEKSDVFSFGVMLLEIVSGKKNTTFYHSEHSFSLLGNAWRLWREGRALELMDPLLNEGSNIQDVLKYIHVGLLCVQEDAADRPTIASVVAMFVGESNNLATPNKPAFFTTRSLSAVESSSHGPEICSKNEVTISTLDGR